MIVIGEWGNNIDGINVNIGVVLMSAKKQYYTGNNVDMGERVVD